MQIILCDFCKKNTDNDDIGHLPYMVKCEIQKNSGWEYIVGKRFKFDMCEPCFDAFMREMRNKIVEK